MELGGYGLTQVCPQSVESEGPLAISSSKALTPRQLACTAKKIAKFFRHLESSSILLPTDNACLDAILAEYINHLYQEGDSISHAGWLLSGLRRFLPSLKGHLPTSSQYYSNWVRGHLPSRAVPIPWGVLKALVATAWKLEHYDIGLCLLLGFVFYLRTMEMITLKWKTLWLMLAAAKSFCAWIIPRLQAHFLNLWSSEIHV